jgi:hypothetical protein
MRSCYCIHSKGMTVKRQTELSGPLVLDRTYRRGLELLARVFNRIGVPSKSKPRRI